jgi:hypothetical protein
VNFNIPIPIAIGTIGRHEDTEKKEDENVRIEDLGIWNVR